MRASARALLGGLTALTLLGGGATAVVLQGSAGEPAEVAPTREPLPPPEPAPERTPLLEAAGTADDGPVPARAAVQALVEQALADPVLGGRLAVSVVDVGSLEVLYERDADAMLLPASTAKIVTAVTALTSLDDEARLTTRVVAGPTPGEVVVVGGGDPTLASSAEAQRTPQDARLDVLAAQVLERLAGLPVRRVVVDDTLYSGPTTGPAWSPSYVSGGNVAPVMALMVDGGRVRPDRRGRSADPALAAGQRLAALLARGGVAPEVVRGKAPDGARELGAVESAPVSTLVERMLSTSDNDLAEALARQVAIAEGQPASFGGAAAALRTASGRVLEPLGVRAEAVRLADGSGLSRDNRLAPGALTRLLTGVLGGDPGALSPVLTGLPVAGFDGTLADRYREGPQVAGAGVVRAKTGTLRGVSALAGVVRTADGRLLAFDLTADAVQGGRVLAAEAVLDRLAAALARCGCR
ncbi:MAG TPA: D-alanyl-D-alanine carboxypeptidase/D-alanyl-D-alanine-endopeptidase [Mycobacteriales bacterium]|nr:D-alanyl-D-alanine carboxypeptidase/D-alanyl-D-alanine-endopeptidase [Mycobacteriales bacterium]